MPNKWDYNPEQIAYIPEQEQPEYMTGAGLAEAAKWYLGQVNENMKRLVPENHWQPNQQGGYTFNPQAMSDEQVNAILGAFGGVAGPVNTVRTPLGAAQTYYWPKGNPDPGVDNAKSWVQYLTHNKEGNPYWWDVVAESPRGFVEMLREVRKVLGPRLDKMELSPMAPDAIPGWSKLANHREISRYPNLQQNIREGVEYATEEIGAEHVPKWTYKRGSAKELRKPELTLDELGALGL